MQEPAPAKDLTALLRSASLADDVADQIFPLVYEELRRLASSRLRGERQGHTLQTTALVHEAYLRLVDQRQAQWQGRQHFFAIAARAMRRVLIDHARRHTAGKRIDKRLLIPLEDAPNIAIEANIDVLALDQALQRLEELDENQARVVELRSFGGLTLDETAEVLGVSRSFVDREWRTAKLWMRREMS